VVGNGITAMPEGRNIWILGDGAESNSPSLDSNLPGLLAGLLDQLLTLGETAAQIKRTLNIEMKI
jgi:hypothetical protein